MNIWKLNNTLSTTIGTKIKGEMKKFLEMNENGKIIYQNLWGAAKAVLQGKFIAMNPYIYNWERSQINNLTLLFKELENKQTESKVSGRKEMINIIAEINEIQNRKTV